MKIGDDFATSTTSATSFHSGILEMAGGLNHRQSTF